MATKPLKKGATYDDLVRVPEHFVAEMFDGELYASPRPALPHARAAGVLFGKLGGSFDFGDGPGGWLLLVEPELHFGNDVIVPDLAGWRRERLPSTPNEPYSTLAPDWICEVLAASTEYIDRGKKLCIYAREGVTHAWLVDPLRRSLEVLALESGDLEPVEEHHGDAAVRARPFDAIELELRVLWS
ncbi:MAG TPA: Uma2 family endonuclease [Gammaproteobacteria bacterium]